MTAYGAVLSPAVRSMRDDLAEIDTGRHKGGPYGRDDIGHAPAFDGEHDARLRTDAPEPRLGTRHGARAVGPHPGEPRLGARMRASGPRSRGTTNGVPCSLTSVPATAGLHAPLGFTNQKAVATAVGVVGLPRRLSTP